MVATKYLSKWNFADRLHHRHRLSGANAARSRRSRPAPRARPPAFGRDPERREKFCREMSERIGVAVEPMKSGEEAVRDADILVTATSATKIVLEGAWLEPGMHVNAMGANWSQKRELDERAVGCANKIAVDSIEQSKMEAGDLIQAFGDDESRWNVVQELAQIVAGKAPGRTSANEITLFKSNGIATWDLAAAVRVYELAVARGMGQSVPLWQSENLCRFSVAQASACGGSSWQPQNPQAEACATQRFLRPAQHETSSDKIMQGLLLLRECRKKIPDKKYARNLPG